MWFLQLNTFIGIVAMGLVLIITSLFSRVSASMRLIIMALMSVLFIGWVDIRLLAFYLAYVAMVYVFARIICILKNARTVVFASCIVLCILPFVAVRMIPVGHFVFIIGLAFALLRGVDTLFYSYYTGEKVSLLAFFNFMMFVPTFTAGPVFRFRDFDRACKTFTKLTFADFVEAIKRIIRGLFKTIVVVHVFMQVFGHFSAEGGSINLPVSFLLIVCSYLILYFNLDGYSDIAIAVGRLYGFIVPENFKQPWCAASFTQFWRSWHRTVSDWIREHVFILLHNKKLGRWQSAGAMVVVMAVMGLWHDFSIPVVLVATFYLGGLLAVENILGLSAPKRKWTALRVIRCLSVNFLFGVNTLIFITDIYTVQSIIRGFFRF